MQGSKTLDRVTQVVTYLEKAIQAGEYRPGDSLPPEREMSSRLGVSRSVVREAIGRLASLGLVQSVHGSATRVQAPTSKPIVQGYRRLLQGSSAKLDQLAAVRLPLETTIAELASQHRSDEQLERMEKTQAILADAQASLEAHVKADLEFHALLAEATGNPLFHVVLAPIQELLIKSRRLTLGKYGADIAVAHHRLILDAVRRRDSAAARAAMLQHMRLNLEHLRPAEGDELTFEL
ncbi:MAG: FCD domain-containing protein [Gemmataceae bacterium]